MNSVKSVFTAGLKWISLMTTARGIPTTARTTVCSTERAVLSVTRTRTRSTVWFSTPKVSPAE